MPGAGVRDGLRALVHRGLRAGGVERRAEPGGGGSHRRRKADRVGHILAMALLQPRSGGTRAGEVFISAVLPHQARQANHAAFGVGFNDYSDCGEQEKCFDEDCVGVCNIFRTMALLCQMITLQDIYDNIDADGFAASTLSFIDELTNDIQDGTTNFPRFSQQEHSGICKAGAPLIGASIVASYAARSLAAGGDATGGQRIVPANWQIDALQEQLIEQWAKASRLWVESTDDVLRDGFGSMHLYIIQFVNVAKTGKHSKPPKGNSKTLSPGGVSTTSSRSAFFLSHGWHCNVEF